MSISRVRVYGMLLLAVLLGLPSMTVADGRRCYPWEMPGGDLCGSSVYLAPQDCKSRGNELWMAWRGQSREGYAYHIDHLSKLKKDCPQLAGSVDRILKALKAQQEKEDKAVKHVKKTVEAVKHYGPRCPPGMFHVPC